MLGFVDWFVLLLFFLVNMVVNNDVDKREKKFLKLVVVMVDFVVEDNI